MAQNSKIEWTAHTVNLYWGCVEVSPGCDHCYARELAKRFGRDVWGLHAPRWFRTEKAFGELHKYQRDAEKAGTTAKVFMQSMSDICEVLPEGHPQRAEMQEAQRRLFEEVVPACPNLRFQFLTKRIGNARRVFPATWLETGFPSNVWLGISVVNQEEVDRDIHKLLEIPAQTRFLSIEPMLSEITLPLSSLIHWVICGGESGHAARPMHPDWVRALRDECVEARVPFFFKQWGEWINNAGIPNDDWNMISGKERFQFTNGIFSKSTPYTPVYKVGKKAAGRLLDGREWNQFPEERLP